MKQVSHPQVLNSIFGLFWWYLEVATDNQFIRLGSVTDARVVNLSSTEIIYSLYICQCLTVA